MSPLPKSEPPFLPSESPPKGALRLRRWLARILLLIGAPILFFFVLEASLRLAGFGSETAFFIRDAAPGRWKSNPHFTDLFLPAHFDLKPLPLRLKEEKTSGGLRVFVLGESAVFGTPEPGFGMAQQLRAQLRAQYPGRPIEVLNLGITAINSHVIYQISRELPRFHPDLVIIYMGNNEVVGPYGPGAVVSSTRPPLAIIRASVALRASRTGQLLLKTIYHFRRENRVTSEWRGMELFAKNRVAGDDPRLDRVYRHFERNLSDIIDSSLASGAQVILSTVLANLHDCPPFISLHKASLTSAELAQWQTEYDRGTREWKGADDANAKVHLESALAIDDHYAECHYILGELAEKQGDICEARRHYIDALHWDALRFRPDPAINRIIRDAAAKYPSRVTLVDLSRELGGDAQSGSSGLSGHEVLLEHVHFNWAGNFKAVRLFAAAFQHISGSGVAAPLLSSDACAFALGYTNCGELNLLYSLRELTSVPPFTAQFAYADEQRRQKHVIENMERNLHAPGVLDEAIAQVRRASAADPENAELYTRAAEIAVLKEDFAGAETSLVKANELLPSPHLYNKKAIAEINQGKLKEAEATLFNSLELDPYFLAVCPQLEEIWVQNREVKQGNAFFNTLLLKYPWSHFVRVTYSDFLLRTGDLADAEAQCRRVVAEDPADIGGFERLINILRQTGRSQEAVSIMIASFPQQRLNYSNNVRLAGFFQERGDLASTVIYLEALCNGSPVPASTELLLAQTFSKLSRPEDSFIHLVEAGRIAKEDNDPETLRVADQLIRQNKILGNFP